MKKRALILFALLVAIVMVIAAQKVGRQIEVNRGGKVVAIYELPQEIDSLTFSTFNIYAVTVASSDESKGSVALSSSEVKHGNTTRLSAEPNKGYAFSNWSVNGEVVSIANPYTATIEENKEFVANFVEIDLYNGHEFVDLGLPSGIKWATCNVGANSPEEYGDYFAWGETLSKNYYYWSSYKYCDGTETTMTKYCANTSYGTIDNKTELELQDDAARVNWGGCWRIPSESEFSELISNCSWESVAEDGINGYKFTSKVNGNYIFLPAAGYTTRDGLEKIGDIGYYWLSSLSETGGNSAMALAIHSGVTISWGGGSRCNGLTVRPVCDLSIGDSIMAVCTVSALATEGGKVTVNGCASTQFISEGGTATLVATPDDGYKFVNWTVNGVQVSDESRYTAVITGNIVFAAKFEEFVPEYVDLGLPSGLKWATCNIGSTAPEGYGDYFAWGETEPKTTYTWGNYKHCNGYYTRLTKYGKTSAYGIKDDKTELESEDDAAYVNWGANWRMPTSGEYAELTNINNCTWTFVTQKGVKGYKVVSKVNGNSIFLPAVGVCDEYGFTSVGSSCSYWSSSLRASSDSRYAMCCSSELSYSFRNIGKAVRAVYVPSVFAVSVLATEGGVVATSATEVEEGGEVTLTAIPNAGYNFVNWTVDGEIVSIETICTIKVTANKEFVANFELDPYNGYEYVDLGLSVKWATCNVGATTPEEYGDYFAWGETEPKDEYSWSTYKYCNGSSSTMTKYCRNSSYGTVDNKTVLELEDDAAHVNWGGDWRMPTRAEQDELRNTNNCTWEWTTQNGVNGYKVTSKVNGNSIFLPAAGCRNNDNLYDAGSLGNYWSSSFNASSSYYAYYVHFNSSNVILTNYYRYLGQSVRAVCE